MTVLFSQLVTGLSVAGILALVAIGLSFTFGQMNVINMAHGEFVLAGAYVPFVLQRSGMDAGGALLLAVPLALLLAGTMGLILEKTLIRHLYGRPLDTLLVTFGVSMILQQVARDLFGAPSVNVRRPGWLDGAVSLGPVSLSYSRLAILVVAALAVAALLFLLSRTPAGRRTRAVTQNRRLAASSGISTRRTDGFTFALGSGLAGVAGVALTLLSPIGPSLGTFYIVDAFLVVIVGGLGHLRGAVLAAVGIGLLNTFLEFNWETSLAKAAVLVAVVAFLQVRPQGLISGKSRALV